MAHLTPLKLSRSAEHSRVWKTKYANTKKCVLTARLKDDKSLMFLITAGRAFHSRGPATEKALSPNFVLVRGMPYSVVIAERSWRRPGNDEIGVIVSVRYGGLVPLWASCISTHSLKRIRWAIGCQCSDIIIPLTCVRDVAPATKRAAAFRIRCSGASVLVNRSASTALQ